jgi:hypothetical protein
MGWTGINPSAPVILLHPCQIRFAHKLRPALFALQFLRGIAGEPGKFAVDQAKPGILLDDGHGGAGIFKNGAILFFGEP